MIPTKPRQPDAGKRKSDANSRSKPIWDHTPGGMATESRERVLSFCAGRDVAHSPPCDLALLPFDLATNEASLIGLVESGLVKKREGKKLARGLLEIRERIESDSFSLDPDLEDVHINLESALQKLAGDSAGRLHSGRSRNDQAACDLRQFHRGRILKFLAQLLETTVAFLDRADHEKETVLPGFSHHQRAFVTTWGHQIASYAEAWIRDIERGWAALSRVNRCPLGAAAGFGTSWDLDRESLADLLGFQGLIENSLDAVTSRLEVEIDVAAWAALWMLHASTAAQDLILFSTKEFGWIALAPELTTGSSIMPQKRNPDFAEVIKGKAAFTQGALVSLLALGKGQPSGYHRDVQISKPIGQDIWREVEDVPFVLRLAIESMKVDRKRMKEATRGGFLEAAEWADVISRESGAPFRRIYEAVGKAVDRSRSKGILTRKSVNDSLRQAGIDHQVDARTERRLRSPELLVNGRMTLGSPNPEMVADHIERMRGALAQWESKIDQTSRGLSRKEKLRTERILELAGVSKG